MSKRKRPTRHITLTITPAKPRNTVLQAAASGQLKMGTAKHQKSQGALRRAEKMAMLKPADE